MPTTISRPQHLLAAVTRRFPRLSESVDALRERRSSTHDWPGWCFLPLAAATATVGAPEAADTITLADATNIAALVTWRDTQGIYRFDHTVFDAG